MTQPLSQADRQKIADHLQAKCPDMRCNMCGGQHFVLNDHLFMPIIADTSANLSLGGPPIYPHAGVTCQNCSNTYWLNVVPLNLMKAQQSPSPVPVAKLG